MINYDECFVRGGESHKLETQNSSNIIFETKTFRGLATMRLGLLGDKGVPDQILLG